MSKLQFPHKILWLASYPKSGNTWFRAFLTALLNNGNVEINQMDTDGIFSQREIFDQISDLESRDMYLDEAKLMVADIYRYLALERNRLSIVKIHDRFGNDIDGRCIVPVDVTLCAIYFVRNPLDIVGSLANHFHCTNEDAVKFLNNHEAHLVKQANNLNIHNQFPQFLSDWSSHVKSWTLLPTFPVYIVKYEDMVLNTFETFSKLLEFIGWQFTTDEIFRAIEASSFDKLKTQEEEKGFSEKSYKSKRFFRSGTIRNWERELRQSQINEIKQCHEEVMNSFKYN